VTKMPPRFSKRKRQRPPLSNPVIVQTAVTLPPPEACGAPRSFTAWRHGQAEAITAAVDSPQRIRGLVLPTGSGKSLIAATIATLTGWRTAVLTSTKGLQDQILGTFGEIGFNDLRGQRAYPCRLFTDDQQVRQYQPAQTSCEAGPCKAGVKCVWKENGCAYYDAVRTAKSTRILVTNYQAWMSQYSFGDGLGDFDCLIADEAHAAPEEVSQFLAAAITPRQLEDNELDAPPQANEIGAWIRWAGEHYPELTRQIDRLGSAAKDGRAGADEIRKLLSLKGLARTLDKLRGAKADEWLVTLRGDYEFHPLDAARYTEGALFREIPRIILTSATLTPGTTTALGVDPAQVGWFIAPSSFPVERRPVIHVTTCRIDHRLDAAGTKLWLTRVDQILNGRADRKGIIHTGSYARAKLIYEHSAHRHRLILHDRTTTAREVERFRTARPGTVMVSPSLTTGFDFAGRACEYQIILKVPWPDSREPVMMARTAKDKQYPAYLAMQELVQAVGRGMRSETDRCETLILDDHVRWFVRQYRQLAPQWFHEAYRSQLTIPPPPPRL
jgi:Rad3-related DNA helicase